MFICLNTSFTASLAVCPTRTDSIWLPGSQPLPTSHLSFSINFPQGGWELATQLCLTPFNHNRKCKQAPKEETHEHTRTCMHMHTRSHVHTHAHTHTGRTGGLLMCTHIIGVSISQRLLDRNQTGNRESLPNALPLLTLPLGVGQGCAAPAHWLEAAGGWL